MKSVCFSGRKFSDDWVPFRKPLPNSAARADGDLRLGDVIARAQRIAVGIEEGQHALALVFVHERPGERQAADGGDGGAQEHPEPDAGHEQERAAAQQHHHRRAEVGLHHDQRDRRQDHGERRQDKEEAPGLLAAEAMVVARQHQDHRHLGDLRGLDLHRPDHQPALRAHAGLADDVDGDQQQQRDDVDRPGERQPDLGVHQRHHQHDAEGHAVAHGMARRPGIEAAAGRRVERHHADAGDRRQHQRQAPVDAPDLLGEADRRRGVQSDDGRTGQAHRPPLLVAGLIATPSCGSGRCGATDRASWSRPARRGRSGRRWRHPPCRARR